MSQISNEELKKLIKQHSELQEIVTSEEDDPYACEACAPKEGSGLYGWICPKCGAVISPYQGFCVKCSGGFDFTWTANPNTTGTEYTISSSSECSTNVNKSRCRKCIHEPNCLQNKDVEGKCPDYKRDAPDGGHYG